MRAHTDIQSMGARSRLIAEITASGSWGAPMPERLDSWKAIAAYLKRDERTVRRWEKEGLPIHRHMHTKRASVYAYKSELDTWWKNGRSRLEAAEAGTAQRPRRALGALLVAVLALALLLVGLDVGGL